MNFNLPFLNSYRFRHNSFYRPPSNPYHYSTPNKEIDSSNSKSTSEKAIENSSTQENRDFFEVFGIKLYYDDILLISLIFFLYSEGVDDSELFITLILLLLN